MLQKLIILILCGLVHNATCSRMKFERSFNEPIYRNDASMLADSVFKREPIYQREALVQTEPMLHQQISRGNEMFGGESKHMMAQEQYLPSQQMISQPIQNEQIIHSEPYYREPIMRAETIIREPIIRESILREPIMRTEPIIRREPIIRPQPVIRADAVYQTAPVIRERPIYGQEPAPYAIMVTPCHCTTQPSCFSQPAPQETFFQPIVPQQFIPPRVTYQKPIIKPEIVQSFVTIPRFHRIIRKTFKPITENIQIAPVSVQAGSEMSGNFNPESIQFTNNRSTYQNQGQVQENTPEPTATVTSRSVPQAPNRFPISQVSSIC